jgi:hypothetical protein
MKTNQSIGETEANMNDDFERFIALKMEFDVVEREMHDTHKEWRRIKEKEPSDRGRPRQTELIIREIGVSHELQHTLSSRSVVS